MPFLERCRRRRRRRRAAVVVVVVVCVAAGAEAASEEREKGGVAARDSLSICIVYGYVYTVMSKSIGTSEIFVEILLYT